MAAERRAEELAAQKKVDDETVAQEKAAKELAAQAKAAKDNEAAQEKAAEEKAAAKKKAAADSYVKIKVDVEVRGVLSCTDEAVTISITEKIDAKPEFKEREWVLDFGEEKDIRAKAKELDGKTVSVKGSAILQYSTYVVTAGELNKEGFRIRGEEGKTISISVLDVERKVAVKSLVAANKE